MKRALLVLALLLMLAPAVAFAQQATETVCQEFYTVRPGDTLFRIAAFNNITLAEIADINDISNINLIFVGEVLCVEEEVIPLFEVYVARPGDNLTRIAALFDTDVDTLLDLNRDTIVNQNRITRGQEIIVPARPDAMMMQTGG